jgi:toxin ParE1/3/4
VNVRMRREAEAEAREAASWYDDQRFGLGTDFLDALTRALEAIESHPLCHARVAGLPAEREVRRALLDRFPYKVVYEMRGEEAVVLAVAHNRRRPNYWEERNPAPRDEE